MLEKIKKALEEAFDLPVYYGTSLEASGNRIYNYIVFWRESTSWRAGSQGDPSRQYVVALVRENFIPEDEEIKMIDTLRSIPGLKAISNDISYGFMTMPGTSLALETAEFRFREPLKRVKISVEG